MRSLVEVRPTFRKQGVRCPFVAIIELYSPQHHLRVGDERFIFAWLRQGETVRLARCAPWLKYSKTPASAITVDEVDTLAISADCTQFRFTPAVEKTFNLTLARRVGDQARAIAIRGVGGGPAADVDITISPELSLVRLGNRGQAAV